MGMPRGLGRQNQAGRALKFIKKQGGVLDGDMAGELGAVVNGSYANLANTMGGKLIALEPGESMDSFQSNRPNATFTGFLSALERDTGRVTPLVQEHLLWALAQQNHKRELPSRNNRTERLIRCIEKGMPDHA